MGVNGGPPNCPQLGLMGDPNAPDNETEWGPQNHQWVQMGTPKSAPIGARGDPKSPLQ